MQAALRKISQGSIVVGISGVIAEQNFPGMSVYGASKAAVRSFDEVLAREARKAGVRVIDARPPQSPNGSSQPLLMTKLICPPPHFQTKRPTTSHTNRVQSSNQVGPFHSDKFPTVINRRQLICWLILSIMAFQTATPISKKSPTRPATATSTSFGCVTGGNTEPYCMLLRPKP